MLNKHRDVSVALNSAVSAIELTTKDACAAAKNARLATEHEKNLLVWRSSKAPAAAPPSTLSPRAAAPEGATGGSAAPSSAPARPSSGSASGAPAALAAAAAGVAAPAAPAAAGGGSSASATAAGGAWELRLVDADGKLVASRWSPDDLSRLNIQELRRMCQLDDSFRVVDFNDGSVIGVGEEASVSVLEVSKVDGMQVTITVKVH